MSQRYSSSSASGSDSESSDSVSYKSPFGMEVDRRESHLSALPGKVYSEYLDSINRASKVFSCNGGELESHLRLFLGTPTHVDELPEGFGDEVNRLLHNYLAALASLRDVQRMVHRKLWPARYVPESKQNLRTVWEVEVWEPKREASFGEDSVKFLVDLRNFSLHYAIPLSTIGTKISWQGGGPVVQENSVRLKRSELLKWSSWKASSRRYIESHDGDIEFLPAIADYSTRVRSFYQWFWDQVIDEVRIPLDEYQSKTNEYMQWRRVEATLGQFGPDGRAIYRPRLAAARLERAEHGTTGWRVFSPDADGNWIAGASDWDPLPEGPR